MKAKKTRIQAAEEAANAAAQIARAAVLEAWDVSAAAVAAQGEQGEHLLEEDQVLKELNEQIALTNQKQVAEAAGITPQQLNQFVHGAISLPEPMAEKLGYTMRRFFVRKAVKR